MLCASRGEPWPPFKDVSSPKPSHSTPTVQQTWHAFCKENRQLTDRLAVWREELAEHARQSRSNLDQCRRSVDESSMQACAVRKCMDRVQEHLEVVVEHGLQISKMTTRLQSVHKECLRALHAEHSNHTHDVQQQFLDTTDGCDLGAAIKALTTAAATSKLLPSAAVATVAVTSTSPPDFTRAVVLEQPPHQEREDEHMVEGMVSDFSPPLWLKKCLCIDPESMHQHSAADTLIALTEEIEWPHNSWRKNALRYCSNCLEWWVNIREPERKGWLAALVMNNYFELLSMLITLYDAMFVAYTSNYRIRHMTNERTGLIKAMEMSILGVYTVELLLRLLLHRVFFFFAHNWKWNIIDLIVVVSSLLSLQDTLGLCHISFVRTVRLLRITRIFLLFRVIGFVEQLRVMMECIQNCFLTVIWCIVLIVFVGFVFAVFFVQNTTEYLASKEVDSAEEAMLLANFGSVENTLLVLFQVVTGGSDWMTHYKLIEPTGQFASLLFLFYIAFFAIAVWNIITSIFIEHAILRVRPTTRDLMVEKHKQDIADIEELKGLFRKIDTDMSRNISAEEFFRFAEDTEAMEALQVRGLDIKDTRLFFQMLSSMGSESDTVGIEEFVNCCLKMRGPASSLDLYTLHCQGRRERRQQFRALMAIQLQLARVEQMLADSRQLLS